MARIVCITSDLKGIVFACCELLRRLEKRGHTVTLASQHDLESLIGDQGLNFFQLNKDTRLDLVESEKQVSKFKRLVKFKERKKQALEAFGVEKFPELVETLKPHILLIEMELHPYILASISTDIPVILINQWMTIWKSKGVPPLHTEIVPGKGFWNDFWKIEKIWFTYRIRKRIRDWKGKIAAVGLDELSTLRQLATHYHVPFRKYAEVFQWLVPCSYRHLPVLCLRAWEFEFPHKIRPNTFYVGPIIQAHRKEQTTNLSDEARLKQLFSKRADKRAAHRLVFCGISSFFNTENEFLKRIIQAIASEKDWDMILSLSQRSQSQNEQQLPSNVHLFEWVPQMKVLQHADLAVIHGGINTVDECVHLKVPMLVYNAGHIDMPGTTARIAYHGLGIIGNRTTDDPETMAKRMRLAMNDENIKQKLESMHRHHARYTEDSVAETVIEKLISQSHTDHFKEA